ncbi:MAG: squalene/phytoene synthase family protein [Gammaproteobacteria bacterium]
MSNDTASETPIEQLFDQSVTQGSARYWAAHFTIEPARPVVKAVLCFAHTMDLLTGVSPEVIAEKSIWWHEELTDTTLTSARHPVTQTLLQHIHEASPENGDSVSAAIVHTMHRHLHGALMSQQRTAIDSDDAWLQYLELRLGTLHELLALASGASNQDAQALGEWATKLHSASILRATEHFQDGRLLTPPDALTENVKTGQPQLPTEQQPLAPPANQVLIDLELKWWKNPPDQASPIFTGLPVGLRGMLAAWRAARKAHSYLI